MAKSPAPAEKKAPTSGPSAGKPRVITFLERYSPHHEFELSVAGALGFYAFLIGVMILAALLYARAEDDETHRPPKMEVVEIQGGDGGLDGLGVGTTPLGGSKGSKTEAENVASAKSPEQPPQLNQKDFALKDPMRGPELKLPTGAQEEPAEDGDPIFAGLGETAKEAQRNLIAALAPPPKAEGKGTGGKVNVGGTPGTGGPAGRGGGKGGKVGPGEGKSPHGRVQTPQFKRAMRWRLLMSDDPKTHFEMLRALKVTLIAPTPTPGLFRVMDLSRSTPAFETTRKVREHADKVWWVTSEPRQVPPLAAYLGLRPRPPFFNIFLSKEMEDRMLVKEREYQGAFEDQIERTEWVVPLRDGHYANEPEVFKQILKR
jgi:hypothetical protein